MNLQRNTQPHFASAAPVPSMGQSNRETSDEYSRVIFRHGKYRVAECSDSIQWFIQRLVSAGRRGPEWRSLSFCTSRDGLKLDWQRHAGIDAPELAVLPEHFASATQVVA